MSKRFFITPVTTLVDGEGKPTTDGYRVFKDIDDRISPHSTPPIYPEYTVATLPTASDYDNGVIIVSDETGGRTLATSDGTNWRRVSDGAVVS